MPVAGPSNTMSLAGRRAFCVQSTHALFLAAITSSLNACAGNPMGSDIDVASASSIPSFNGTIVNGTIALTVASVPSLATVGGAVLVLTSSTQILVSRTGEQTFAAVSAICTHQSCTIDRRTGDTYVCRCHGSAFTSTGAVVQGPADRPLETKAITFADGVATIRV